MGSHFEKKAHLETTAQIVVAYVSHNSIGASDLPGIITSVGDCFAALGAKAEANSTSNPEPMVPVRRSVSENHVTCLVCGKKHKMLRRHLRAIHELTPSAYREMFGLKDHYPMTAPSYARLRSELAKSFGLGRRKTAASQRRLP